MKRLLLFLLSLSPSLCILGSVEVFEISPRNLDQLTGGKEADGIIGDFILRNDRIEVLIGGGAPDRKANMGAFWGPKGMTPVVSMI